jgi:hypothetical protein
VVPLPSLTRVWEALSSFLGENGFLGACGGDSNTAELNCYAELGRSQVCDQNLARLRAFLEAEEAIVSFESGAVQDAYYGPFDDQKIGGGYSIWPPGHGRSEGTRPGGGACALRAHAPERDPKFRGLTTFQHGFESRWGRQLSFPTWMSFK